MLPFPRSPQRWSSGVVVRVAALTSFALATACQHPTVGGGAGNPGSGGGSGAATGGGGNAGGGVITDGGGMGGAAGTGPTRGPTPPRAGTSFPFPQNREASGCIYPTAYRNEDVQLAYDQWKRDTVTSDGAGGFLRVKRPMDTPLDQNSTVSEGIGYGMIVAVFMGDQVTFDGLWKYEQAKLDENGLMNWYILADGSVGTNPVGGGGATDADEDMAFALLMADKQWGGKGSLSDTYFSYAKKQIAAIWLHEVVDSKLAGPGDHWADQWNNINISYFAPAYYRLFQKVVVTDTPGWPSGAAAPDWNAVIQTVYDTIAIALSSQNGNQNNGLVPAWCASHTTVCSPRDSASNYQYDSCRTPFRIGLDWCWNGEARAQAYVTKTSNFFSGLGGVANIADGYALNGTPQPANAGKGSAAFVGPAAVGAMSAATYRTFLDQAYGAVATRQLLAGGTYYEESWTVMSLLMMTGNFLDYTRY